MKRKNFDAAPCSIARTLDVIGDWWTPLIIRECLYGVSQFTGFHTALGIGRNILTRRLAQLVEQGVLERRRRTDSDSRFEYHLTDKGYDAAAILLAMMHFGDTWLFQGESGTPIVIYDRRTGRRVSPSVVDANTGEPLDPRNLFAGPGLGFPASDKIRRQRFAEYYSRADERLEKTGNPKRH